MACEYKIGHSLYYSTGRMLLAPMWNNMLVLVLNFSRIS